MPRRIRGETRQNKTGTWGKCWGSMVPADPVSVCSWNAPSPPHVPPQLAVLSSPFTGKLLLGASGLSLCVLPQEPGLRPSQTGAPTACLNVHLFLPDSAPRGQGPVYPVHASPQSHGKVALRINLRNGMNRHANFLSPAACPFPILSLNMDCTDDGLDKELTPSLI